MPTTCPRCRSMLDASMALCRSCGWSAPYLVRRQAAPRAEMTFTERYRGTEYESAPFVVVAPRAGVARGRIFVIMSAVALLALIIVAGSIILGPPT
jgi:hypothetical protein